MFSVFKFISDLGQEERFQSILSSILYLWRLVWKFSGTQVLYWCMLTREAIQTLVLRNNQLELLEHPSYKLSFQTKLTRDCPLTHESNTYKILVEVPKARII